jgi:hypothetical protein
MQRQILPPVFALFVALCTAGCAHQPGAFRLTTPGTTPILVPPGIKDANVAKSVVRIAPIPRKTPCNPSPHGLLVQRKFFSRPQVIVAQQALNSATADELFSWTVDLEKQGCIPTNTGLQLAESIIDALPLELPKRAQLLQGRGYLRSVNSLRVVSPIYKPGASTDAGVITAITQSETNYNLKVDLIDSHSTTGYEIDWYDLLAVPNAPGYRIVLRSAEVHIDDKVEHPVSPSTDRFPSGPNPRWYQLFMMTKVSANDFDFVVVSARSPAELLDDVTNFQSDSTAFLHNADPDSYIAIPHGSGINSYIRIKENGNPVDLMRGSTVSTAIYVATTADAHIALPRLKIRKLHDGKLFPVEWDRASDKILSLPLEGGEELDW